MNDKITGLDLVIDCDAYDEFADYCEQYFAVAANNFEILNNNIDIMQRNIAIAVRNYRLDEVVKADTGDGTVLTAAELDRVNSLRAVNLDDFDVLRQRLEQFKIESSKIKQSSQAELEIFSARLGMFQDLFNSTIKYIGLQSFSSEPFEELEEFEEFPVEPEPPKW